MKKILILCLLAFVYNNTFAKIVNKVKASEIALEIIKFKTQNDYYKVKSINLLNNNIYFIDLYPKGWMLMSNEDKFEPLLAYSLADNFNLDCNIPQSMEFYINLYSKRIDKISNEDGKSLIQWNKMYYSTINHSRTIGTSIEPIIKVNWNQNEPYNKYCPMKGSKRSIVGCVAVAMGQAISVTRHPDKPIGKFSSTSAVSTIKTFDFDEQKSYDWNKISNGETDKYDEVARLLYHLGISVDMQYGVDASGTYTYLVENALKKHFSFNNVKYLWRDEYKGNWEQLMINELGAGRPIIYNGVDTKNNSGHCFNLDGYDGTGSFHVNWGWGGIGNAYFNLNALRDQFMGMDYSDQQGAVIGISAPSEKPQNIILSNLEVPSGERPGLKVAKITVDTSAPNHEFTYNIRGKYISENEYENIPFEIIGNEIYTTSSISYTAGSYDIEIVATDKTINSSISQGFSIKVTGNSEALKTLEEGTSLEYSKETCILSITSNVGVIYNICDENGKILKEGTFINDNPINIDTNKVNINKLIIRLSDDYDKKELSITIK